MNDMFLEIEKEFLSKNIKANDRSANIKHNKFNISHTIGKIDFMNNLCEDFILHKEKKLNKLFDKYI